MVPSCQTSLFWESELGGSKLADTHQLVGRTLAVPSSPILVHWRVRAWWFQVRRTLSFCRLELGGSKFVDPRELAVGDWQCQVCRSVSISRSEFGGIKFVKPHCFVSWSLAMPIFSEPRHFMGRSLVVPSLSIFGRWVGVWSCRVHHALFFSVL